MTSHLTASSSGYGMPLFLIVAIIALTVSGVLPALFRVAVLLIKPKMIYRHKAEKYKVMWIEAVQDRDHWREKYIQAVLDADDVEIEEDEIGLDIDAIYERTPLDIENNEDQVKYL